MKYDGYVVVIFLTFVVAVQSQTNYCNFPNCRHTMCIYPKAGPSAQCTNLKGNGLTAAEKQRILAAHNTFRERVARGLETRGRPGPQPAGTIPKLVWNNELATIAQRWAEQCTIRSDLCRRTAQYSWVNRNLAVIETTANVNTITVESLVKVWTDEVVNFNRNQVPNYSFIFSSDSTTYTQVVWAATTQLGCGATKYAVRGLNRFYLVCNYAPGGNLQGERVY